MAREDEQRLKDLLRNIETGDIPEDLPDPEEYDDMGGIKSLDRGAPSIKLASETGQEEFELELMSVIREFNDKMQNGELDPSTTIDEYINDYLSRKKMMMEDKNRQMAMYGGRMKYAMGTPESSKIEALLKSLKSKADPFIKEAVTLEALVEKFKDKDEIPKALSRMEKDYPDAMKKKYNFMDLIDTKAEDEYYKIKEELLDRKYNAKNYPPSQRNMSMEELKKMLKKAEEDKVKRAKGGIAGVL